MKRFSHLCLCSLLLWLPSMGHAANVSPETSVNTVTLSTSDSLLAVDEEQLVTALINMVHKQQQLKAQHNRQMADWLHTQLLVEALTPPTNGDVQANSLSRLSARVAQLEQLVQQMISQQLQTRKLLTLQAANQFTNVPQSTSPELQQLLDDQAYMLQLLEKKRPEAKTKQTTVVPIPLPVNATRDDSLAHQIKVLQAQLKELQTSPNAVVQVDVPQMQRVAPVLSMQPTPSLLTMNDSLRGKWVGEAPTIAVVPFDFERSVFFPLSSSRLGNDAQQKLAETLQFLSDFPQEKIVLRGYASPDGNRKFNLRLAQQRQQAVQNYLLQHGVDQSRIILSDCGVNHSDVAAQVVRRVDISLQK